MDVAAFHLLRLINTALRVCTFRNKKQSDFVILGPINYR